MNFKMPTIVLVINFKMPTIVLVINFKMPTIDLVINFKMPTIVGILKLMTRTKNDIVYCSEKDIASFFSILIFDIYEENKFHAHDFFFIISGGLATDNIKGSSHICRASAILI